MSNRCGVKPLFVGLGLLLTAGAVSACASAPIDMRGSPSGDAVSAQVELRTNANALADRLDEAGWAVSATPAEVTRSFFDRLIGGGQTETQDDEPDPVAIYLASASQSSVVEADLSGLIEASNALTAETLRVASSDQALQAQTLARDIAAVERALGAMRRATRFFEAVLAQGDWEGPTPYQLQAQLDLAEEAEARLSSAADALAERRWAARSGLFG